MIEVIEYKFKSEEKLTIDAILFVIITGPILKKNVIK